MEIVLSALHILLILGLFAFLMVELFLLRIEASKKTISIIARVDMLYGLFSVLVIVSGVLRVALGEKGASFYVHNPVFWVKMGFFLLIGILSIPPSIRFFRWKKAVTADGQIPPAEALASARRYVHFELALFVIIPVLAAWLART